MYHVIGAGLAGPEAAYQLAKAGHKVRLYEMKPEKFSPAHKFPGPAELVCSNSLGSDNPGSAGALLKAELRLLDSLIIKSADKAKVPAGSALAVDRVAMSKIVEEALLKIENIEYIKGEVKELPQGDVLIATGPLTSDDLTTTIDSLVGNRLFFFDATSPIIDSESIDRNKVYAASRWGKGDADYLNCPMTKEEYFNFVNAVMDAEKVTPHDFEKFSIFEGCMPIEQIAARGEMTLAFGPLRPVGLPDPETGKIPFAVVQLRKEDLEAESYNLVGFQTRMTFGEQERVFRMIPGLENAEFLRFGVMHRNTYIDSPRVLNSRLSLIKDPRIRFLGQITGVEGYVESTASGLLGALLAMNEDIPLPPAKTMIGALHKYVTGYEGEDFQPMAANYGLLPPIGRKMRKRDRKQEYHKRGVSALENWLKEWK